MSLTARTLFDPRVCRVNLTIRDAGVIAVPPAAATAWQAASALPPTPSAASYLSAESLDEILNGLAQLALQQLFDLWPALAGFVIESEAD